jgi:putative phosphoesterase
MNDSVIGVISDTHGLLRPEACDALQGVSRIIHAGDIDNSAVLDELERIAPVVAVRGNCDTGAWADRLPETQTVDLDGTLLYVVHDLHDLDLDPAAAGIRAVISGHSHRPSIHHVQGVLYLNPGSAGPRRFKLPISLARLTLAQGELLPELVTLAP